MPAKHKYTSGSSSEKDIHSVCTYICMCRDLCKNICSRQFCHVPHARFQSHVDKSLTTLAPAPKGYIVHIFHLLLSTSTVPINAAFLCLQKDNCARHILSKKQTKNLANEKFGVIFKKTCTPFRLVLRGESDRVVDPPVRAWRGNACNRHQKRRKPWLSPLFSKLFP